MSDWSLIYIGTKKLLDLLICLRMFLLPLLLLPVPVVMLCAPLNKDIYIYIEREREREKVYTNKRVDRSIS